MFPRLPVMFPRLHLKFPPLSGKIQNMLAIVLNVEESDTTADATRIKAGSKKIL
jgi:hypothetical protein